MLDRADPRRTRVGPFELDVESGELSDNGHRQILPEQPLALLKALIARPGGLVTRDELRKELWPEDTFVDFERGLNAAVKRLRDVLGDSADAPQFIETVPRRGYRFIAPVEFGSQGEPGPVPRQSPVVGSWSTRVALSVLVCATASVGVWRYRAAAPETASVERPMRVTPLTTLSGDEDVATFSPDDKEVAFAHGQTTPDVPDGNWGIYVAAVGSGEWSRLSPDHRADRVSDQMPSWSPDGLHIAFLRTEPGASTPALIYMMSPLGTSILKLSDFPVRPGSIVSWTSDSNSILAGRDTTRPDGDDGGIYLVPVHGGALRRLTTPSRSTSDYSPVLSPDGARVAYISCQNDLNCEIDTIGITADFVQVGSPHRVVSASISSSVAWTRDGTSLVYGALVQPWAGYLWRIDVAGEGTPERLELAGRQAWLPVISRGKHLLAFEQCKVHPEIDRLEPSGALAPALASSVGDYDPAFSPDGQRIAFASLRSVEHPEIWLSNIDGTATQQLTHGPGSWQGSPSWSPDGQKLAFDSRGDDGHWHIWTIDPRGGTALQVTRGNGDQNIPAWSADSRQIYFSASADGGIHRDIWRVSSSGGEPEQVTNTGSGAKAYEWGRGKYLVYQRHDGDSPVLLLPLSGGSPRQLAPCAAAPSSFNVGQKGIYYVGCERSTVRSVHLVDPTTGRDRVLGTITDMHNMFTPIAVSPDGKGMLYTRAMNPGGTDLMLIENFK
jgi:Tol biopolymer transport system component/DNA-binding winged helix-turn-helix (wHTH) protein